MSGASRLQSHPWATPEFTSPGEISKLTRIDALHPKKLRPSCSFLTWYSRRLTTPLAGVGRLLVYSRQAPSPAPPYTKRLPLPIEISLSNPDSSIPTDNQNSYLPYTLENWEAVKDAFEQPSIEKKKQHVQGWSPGVFAEQGCVPKCKGSTPKVRAGCPGVHHQ